MSEEPVIKLTRKQLYDEIWDISVAGLARKYDIPYTQLMRQIKEASIPVPSSGYWTQLDYGKLAIKPELPEPADVMVPIYKTIPHTETKKKNVDRPHKQVMKITQKDEKKPVLTVLVDETTARAAVAPPVEKVEINTVTEEPMVSATIEVSEPETCTQYGQTYNIYNRETLYKEIWENPVTEVAKRYKVSDVAIHKVCKSLGIPTPPKGYWTKLRAGKHVSIIPLPKNDKIAQKTGIRTGATTTKPEAEKENLAFLSEEDRTVILSVASQILLPGEDDHMHQKIIAHRKVIAEWRKQHKSDETKSLNRRISDTVPFLTEIIADTSIPRACRIIDALIKAMEPLDCSLTNDLGFVVNNETIQISFSESKDEVNHIPSKEENLQLLKYEEERKRYSWASKPQIRKYDHVFNGKLSLAINGIIKFRDCKTYVLEDHLGDIMIDLYEAAEKIKKAREAREEAERIKKEEEHQKEERQKRYNLEVDRTHALTNLAEDYDTACKIRRYIAIVESSETLDGKTVEWIEWAKAKADWYDPTVAREDEFFGKREHEKAIDKKKLEHKGYWW